MRMPAPMPGKGTIQAKDPFASAPPGYGLTQDNARWPWGQPSRDADPEVVLEKALQGLERPKVKQEVRAGPARARARAPPRHSRAARQVLANEGDIGETPA